MRTTVTPAHYRRLVAAVHAQRLVRELAREFVRTPRRWRDDLGEHIDVRGLPPPQPLVAIMCLVHEQRDTGTAVIVHHDRDPLLLYAELAQIGWMAEHLASDADIVLLRLARCGRLP